MRTGLLRRVARNTAGRDFIVGDIHGMFSKLQTNLDAIGFNSDMDRLFSVGDLVDRGPECEAALEWLARPWFFAVAGNHEVFAIDWPKGGMDAHYYIANGGAWNAFLSKDESLSFAEAFAALPVVIELETSAGPVGIVHADCPLPSWRDFVAALETGWVKGDDGEMCNDRLALDGVVNAAQWSRRRIDLGIIGYQAADVADVRAVVVGHTPLESPRWIGNVLHIDTGACYDGGYFTVVEAETLLVADAA